MALAALLLVSFSEAAAPSLPDSQPLAAPAGGAFPSRFESLPALQTGVDFVYQWNEAARYERLLNSSAVGGGVAVGDYDGDGLPDLCLTRPAGGFQLYRNLGQFHFTNVTEQAGLLDPSVWTTGATFVDIDNDGRLDLFVCCYNSPNRLYLNQGNGTFREAAKSFGLDFSGASFMAAFGDFDRDGRLDAYLLTGGLIPSPAQRFRVQFVNGRPVVPAELQEYWQMFYLPGERAAAAEAGQRDHLYHNNGNGTFTDVSETAGITGFDFGNAAVWWDYNGDGWPDLYVADDYFGPDHLYRNNHDGTFTDVAKEALPHTPWTSMGADIADLNNDGRLDLMASDMSGTTRAQRMIDMIDMEKSAWFLEFPEPRQYLRNAVYLNTGTGRFMEAAYLLGLADTGWTWSLVFGDLDNDGWVDLFIPNGMTRDWMDIDLALQAKSLPPSAFGNFWRSQPVRADRNLAFRNQGDLRFENVSQAWGLDHPGPSFGAALADLDGDGNLDLVVNDFNGPARLYRNRSHGAHRVRVQLRGTRSNRFGIGATVRVETASGQQMRPLTLAHGFMSATEPVVHFGLGTNELIQKLTVEWPSGTRQEFQGLAADRFYTIQEPAESSAVAAVPSPEPATLFVRSAALSGARHEPEKVDEYQRQPLLPARLSSGGPGMAWGDVNHDGFDDLYLTGTSQRPGQLLLGDGHGTFKLDAASGLGSDADEQGALFFDANGDGFEDLYVVSGGVTDPAGSPRYRDRLYLNDGHGHFTLAREGTLPDLRDSGSVVVAADFDRDGDLDLFVGGRSVPGQYPVAPESRLLRNDQGRFTDVTAELAPELRRAGLVTSAVWSDVNNDGWMDLVVACEWGPIRYFQNEHGHLVERTREAGLAERTGWWNSVAAADLNQDGAIDLVVGNRGLNTREHPNPAQPAVLLYGDFEGHGSPQVLQAESTSDRLAPVQGRSSVAKAMPELLAKFPSHHAFAAASLADIVGTHALQSASRWEVNTAESGVLLNDGRGHFHFQALPRIAQVAPVEGIALADVDGDGTVDLYLTQNFYGSRPEAGRMDGGVSLLLLGRGDGSFEPVWPDRSGLLVPGDARSAAAVDLNGDGWVDFAVGMNEGVALAFENRGSKENRVLTIRLEGKLGNRTGIGARVTLVLANGQRRVSEVYGGGGYLSQSPAVIRFGLGRTDRPAQVEVRWPDGQETSQTVYGEGLATRVVQP